MPSTYTPIQSYALGSNQATITFSSIPSTYTDLVLIIKAASSVGGAAMSFQLNGDTTTSNYSVTGLYGDGSVAGSYRLSNNTISGAGSVPNAAIVNFQNYSNTSTYKTVLARGSIADGDTRATISLWRNTAAVNQIIMGIGSGYSFVAGSIFTLYGIKAA